jgi:hypothetical protein
MRIAAYLPLAGTRTPKHADGMRTGRLLGRTWEWLRTLHAETREASERMWLLQQPWQEELLHWSADGHLHGERLPASRRSRSTTSSGWCPGLRFASHP